DRYARVAAERSREQQAMLGYLDTGECRMEYLRRELDDPAAGPCGRCDNCTGRHWPAAVSAADVTVAGQRLMRPGVEIEPRRMWPAGMRDLGVDASGKIPAWDWTQRPAGVLTVPSRSHPELVESLGQRIAEIGRLPYLGALGYAGEEDSRAGVTGARHYNSAQRLQAVWQELRMPGTLSAAVARSGGPVLLIDDRIETGWTMTVAAKLVREAGAPAVLPLVLAVTAG